MIEIKLTKYVLYMTEQELTGLLAKDPELWKAAIQRGKAFTRARQNRERLKTKAEEASRQI